MLPGRSARAGFVLAIAVGVVAVVFFTTRRREEPPPPEPIERGDPAATIESQGAFLVQVKGERETVRVEAEKQFSYPDGSTRLINAKVTSDSPGQDLRRDRRRSEGRREPDQPRHEGQRRA